MTKVTQTITFKASSTFKGKDTGDITLCLEVSRGYLDCMSSDQVKTILQKMLDDYDSGSSFKSTLISYEVSDLHLHMDGRKFEQHVIETN